MQRTGRLRRPRGTHALAWTLATGAATTLSWFGVHTVLDDTSYEPPRALPVSDGPEAGGSGAGAAPRASSTHRPRPHPPSASPSPSEKPHRTPRRTPSKKPRPASEGPERGRGGTGQVEGATVRGGRAVFDMGADSATLVSATPDPGWEMKVWHNQGYIRVTFTSGATSSSVFCRWDDARPRIETFDG
ncbi:hypothetical protein ABZ820_06400 [Streptomyces diacarni]|uniref:hypothetical protein n=1 Tax=Streptomyces diacarni TaxID=2800381 RepID=UPI003409D7ED